MVAYQQSINNWLSIQGNQIGVRLAHAQTNLRWIKGNEISFKVKSQNFQFEKKIIGQYLSKVEETHHEFVGEYPKETCTCALGEKYKILLGNIICDSKRWNWQMSIYK